MCKYKVLDGANIEFMYDINGELHKFVWNASGTIELKDEKFPKTESDIKATSNYEFLNLLKSMVNNN